MQQNSPLRGTTDRPTNLPTSSPSTLAQRLLAALPQTQCTRCGYADCEGYAVALAQGEAAINQCPPGGAEGIERLSAITGQVNLPLNTEHGIEAPRLMMWIDEDWCIGCTLCLKACPVDAIVGSNKRMHTIIESACTGCELCLPACPVDCIQTETATPGLTGWQAWSEMQAQATRKRYEHHQIRLGLPVPGMAAVKCATGNIQAEKLQPAKPNIERPAVQPSLWLLAEDSDITTPAEPDSFGKTETTRISPSGSWPYHPHQATPLAAAPTPTLATGEDHKRAAIAAALAKAREARKQRTG